MSVFESLMFAVTFAALVVVILSFNHKKTILELDARRDGLFHSINADPL